MKQYIHLLSVLLMTLLLATACQSARESVPQANTERKCSGRNSPERNCRYHPKTSDCHAGRNVTGTCGLYK